MGVFTVVRFNTVMCGGAEWRTLMDNSALAKGLDRVAEPYRTLVRRFLESLLKRYGDCLVSVVLFGSVARGDFRSTSDIDLLIVMRGVGRLSRMRRYYMIVDAIECVEELRTRIAEAGIFTGISPVILDYEEAKYFRPLYIELVHDAIILYDKGNFMRELLRRLSELLAERYEARRVSMGRRWYWVFRKGNPLIDLCGVKLVE